MSNKTARFYDNTKSEKFFKIMKKPARARCFGLEAWVYSEIAAKLMVIEAYESGLKDAAHSGQPEPSPR